MLPAVVLAAGLGTRLLPITARWAKPVLPIDGEPVLGHLLRELHAAGCPEAIVVVGHLEQQVRDLCGDGGGLALRYRRQVEPGSAGAVAAAGAEPPYLVVAADTVFSSGDLAAFAQRFAAGGAAGAVALRPRNAGDPPRNGIRARGGLVERLLAGDGTHRGAPLWAAGAAVAARIAALPGAPPYELATAFRAAIDAGEPIAGIEIGPTRELTTPIDLLLENFPYLGGL